VRKYETGIYVQKRHSDWLTMLRTILFEVLAIASDTFLPSFRQCVDARPKETVPLVLKTSHRNRSTFRHQSQFDGEIISFCTWRAEFCKCFFGFPAVVQSMYVEPIFPPSKSCPWLLNVWKLLLVLHLIDPRVVVAFERHPHPTKLAIRCLQTFSVVFHVRHFSRQNRHF